MTTTTTCPRCQTPNALDDASLQCIRCDSSAPSDRWDGSAKPLIGGPVDVPREGRITTTGELLRGLLAIAAARTERRRSDRPPPPAAAAVSTLQDDDDVGGTVTYGDVARTKGIAAAAKASFSMGDAARFADRMTPVPVATAAAESSREEEPVDGSLIARSLESLCIRVRAHPRGVACVIDLLTLVASADGVIDDAEIDAITSAVGVLLGGIRLPQYMQLLVRSSVDEIHKLGAAETMLGIAEVLSECRAAEDGLVMSIAIAYASYGMCPPERATIRALAGVVDVNGDRCEELIRLVRAEVAPGA